MEKSETMQLCYLLPLAAGSFPGFLGKAEYWAFSAPAALHIILSVLATAAEVKSCWILPSTELLFFFWCSISPLATNKQIKSSISGLFCSLICFFSPPFQIRFLTIFYTSTIYLLIFHLLPIIYHFILGVSLLWCSHWHTSPVGGLFSHARCKLRHTNWLVHRNSINNLIRHWIESGNLYRHAKKHGTNFT